MRRTAEAYGFAWSYFNYDGPFGLIKEDGKRELDPVTLASLGLKSRCDAVEISQPGIPSDMGSGSPALCGTRCPNVDEFGGQKP